MNDRATSTAPLLEPDLAASAATMAVARAGIDAEGPRSYPGGKNGAGVFQRLINLMPPHRCYIEAFLGSGAIMRRKKRAAENVGIDADAGVIAGHVAGGHLAGVELIHGCALSWLADRRWSGDELVYCDPPYLGSARSRPARAIYAHEMTAKGEHEELLRIVKACPALVIISGYPSPLYDRLLLGWRRVDYMAQTRGGAKPECAWLNFPEPAELHDYGWIGDDFRERMRIGRKINRWTRRLAAMPTLERAAILAALGAGAARR